MQLLKVPQGEFHLSRFPIRSKDKMRAWDAADEYLLSYLYENHEERVDNHNVLIINDSFGALAVALTESKLTIWTDSYLAQEGLLQNFTSNSLSSENVAIKNSVETPEGKYDIVLIKVPKSLALLEDQLARIKPLLSSKSIVIAAGMVKSIHTSTLKLFGKYIGLTKTSLAKKKARLIFCQPDENIKAINSPYPKRYTLENTEHTLINHANVFSRENLDIGTRFFLQHIPMSDKYKTIIDLGCGNGVVGLIAAEKNPQAKIVFVDSSFMAIESARETFLNSSLNIERASFQANDCLTDIEENSADLILNNPPFHQDNAIGDEVAWKMFQQSKNILKKNAELFVIGNRHLAYHIKLKKIFGNCEVIATNKKFVILKSVKL